MKLKMAFVMDPIGTINTEKDTTFVLMLEAQARGQQAEQQQPSFQQITASELYCPNCKCSMPVREKMLLYVPGGELHDYLCQKCGASLGTRTDC